MFALNSTLDMYAQTCLPPQLSSIFCVFVYLWRPWQWRFLLFLWNLNKANPIRGDHFLLTVAQ